MYRCNRGSQPLIPPAIPVLEGPSLLSMLIWRSVYPSSYNFSSRKMILSLASFMCWDCLLFLKILNVLNTPLRWIRAPSTSDSPNPQTHNGPQQPRPSIPHKGFRVSGLSQTGAPNSMQPKAPHGRLLCTRHLKGRADARREEL